jgi:aldehyde:ferredoxin oxidoreductase
MYGYHGRILHVNLSNGQIDIETFDETFAKTYLGGNGFAIRLLYEHLAAGVEPLSPDNMLVFAVGPTTDTIVPGATRCCVGIKSPLTGLFFDSTFGGMFAAMQKRTGFEAITITGRAAQPVYLLVHEDGATIKPARICGAASRVTPTMPLGRARMMQPKCPLLVQVEKIWCALPVLCIPGTKAVMAWQDVAVWAR